MYRSYIPYLQHILDECLYIRSVITDDMEKKSQEKYDKPHVENRSPQVMKQVNVLCTLI